LPALLRNACDVVLVTPGGVQGNWEYGLPTGRAICK